MSMEEPIENQELKPDDHKIQPDTNNNVTMEIDSVKTEAKKEITEKTVVTVKEKEKSQETGENTEHNEPEQETEASYTIPGLLQT